MMCYIFKDFSYYVIVKFSRRCKRDGNVSFGRPKILKLLSSTVSILSFQYRGSPPHNADAYSKTSLILVS
jgi:hypothetical protein